jgi:cell division protein FtsA
VDELGDMVERELAAADMAGHLPAGAVLVGGGTELPGLPRRLFERWEMPVRIGRPSGLSGLADAVRGPAHASAVGLLLWAARGVSGASAVPHERSTPAAADGMGRVLSWAREAFLPGDAHRHLGS